MQKGHRLWQISGRKVTDLHLVRFLRSRYGRCPGWGDRWEAVRGTQVVPWGRRTGDRVRRSAVRRMDGSQQEASVEGACREDPARLLRAGVCHVPGPCREL